VDRRLHLTQRTTDDARQVARPVLLGEGDGGQVLPWMARETSFRVAFALLDLVNVIMIVSEKIDIGPYDDDALCKGAIWAQRCSRSTPIV
jgi:hypothetical protein